MKYGIEVAFIAQFFAAKYEEFFDAVKASIKEQGVVNGETKSVTCCFGKISIKSRANKQLNKTALLELVQSGKVSNEMLVQVINKLDNDQLTKLFGKQVTDSLYFDGAPSEFLAIEASAQAKTFLETVFVHHDVSVDSAKVIEDYKCCGTKVA